MNIRAGVMKRNLIRVKCMCRLLSVVTLKEVGLIVQVGAIGCR